MWAQAVLNLDVIWQCVCVQRPDADCLPRLPTRGMETNSIVQAPKGIPLPSRAGRPSSPACAEGGHGHSLCRLQQRPWLLAALDAAEHHGRRLQGR